MDDLFFVNDKDQSVELKRNSALPSSAEEALQLSIKKWEFIEEYYNEDREYPFVDDGGTSSCACCQIFMTEKYSLNRGTHIDCGLCPIAEYGHEFCRDTPYTQYIDLFYDAEDWNTGDDEVIDRYRDELQIIAREEIDFLEEVLDHIRNEQ